MGDSSVSDRIYGKKGKESILGVEHLINKITWQIIAIELFMHLREKCILNEPKWNFNMGRLVFEQSKF